MTIEEAAQSLSKKLSQSFKPGEVTVGIGRNVIYVYEHVRGFAKLRMKSGETYEGFKVIRKYVGKFKPVGN